MAYSQTIKIAVDLRVAAQRSDSDIDSFKDRARIFSIK